MLPPAAFNQYMKTNNTNKRIDTMQDNLMKRLMTGLLKLLRAKRVDYYILNKTGESYLTKQ